jgi:RNA polymerase sigma factor (sigma-70 family)
VCESEAATDDELCARMARGDSAALAALFQRHGSRLLLMGKVMLGDASEAEDVVQEVFLEAWRKAQSFDAERGSVRAWLAVRMRSRCLDRSDPAGRLAPYCHRAWTTATDLPTRGRARSAAPTTRRSFVR